MSMSPTADRYALGLDLGGTKIFAGLIDAQGNVRDQWRLPTPTEGGAPAILRSLVEAVGTIRGNLSEQDRERLVGIGVSSAGQINQKTGVVEYCTPNLPGWGGTPIVEAIEKAHGLRTCADNDGNCAAFGEYWMGAGQGVRNLVALTIGTGLGGGLIIDGQLVRGARGGGGELGHTILEPGGHKCNCGQQGCIETYVSGTALARAAARSGYWNPAPSSHQIFEMARGGDERALSLIQDMMHDLAVGIVTILNFVDPERIIIGGGVGEQGDLILPMLRERIVNLYGERGWDPANVVLAKLGERAGMIGAAGQAFERFGALELAVQ